MSVWTIKVVEETIVEALRYASRHAGRVGPQGIKSGALPFVIGSVEEYIEIWGDIPERAGDDDGDEMPVEYLPPYRVTLYTEALQWQCRYLPEQASPTEMRVFAAHLAAALRGTPTDKAARRLNLTRPRFYQLKDRAAGRIAIGLMRDRIGSNGLPEDEDDE